MAEDFNWFAANAPTRAVNIAAPILEVQATCARKQAAISAIEPLPCGGTHVVLVTIEGADTLRAAYKEKLLDRRTPRTPLRPRTV